MKIMVFVAMTLSASDGPLDKLRGWSSNDSFSQHYPCHFLKFSSGSANPKPHDRVATHTGSGSSMKEVVHTFPSARSEEVGTYQLVREGTFLVQEELSCQGAGGSQEDIADDHLQEACCSIEVGMPEDSKEVEVHRKEHSLSLLP